MHDDDRDDEEELPLKYNKNGLIRGPGHRKKAKSAIGTKLSPAVIHKWKAIARSRGEPLNKVMSDLVSAEFERNPVPLD